MNEIISQMIKLDGQKQDEIGKLEVEIEQSKIWLEENEEEILKVIEWHNSRLGYFRENKNATPDEVKKMSDTDKWIEEKQTQLAAHREIVEKNSISIERYFDEKKKAMLEKLLNTVAFERKRSFQPMNEKDYKMELEQLDAGALIEEKLRLYEIAKGLSQTLAPYEYEYLMLAIDELYEKENKLTYELSQQTQSKLT